MLFDIPFVANWHKIGEHRQSLTDCSNQCKSLQIDYNYKVADKVLFEKEGIICKAESNYGKEPWTITTVHANGMELSGFNKEPKQNELISKK